MESPPLKCPTHDFANMIIRLEIPPCCIIAPASIKKKIASSVYFEPPLYILEAIVINGSPSIRQIDAALARSRDHANGTPSIKVTTNTINNTSMGFILLPPPLLPSGLLPDV